MLRFPLAPSPDRCQEQQDGTWERYETFGKSYHLQPLLINPNNETITIRHVIDYFKHILHTLLLS